MAAGGNNLARLLGSNGFPSGACGNQIMLSLLSANREMERAENGFSEILSGGGVPEFAQDLPENSISADVEFPQLNIPAAADNLPAVGLTDI